MGTKFKVGWDYLLVKVGISGDRLKFSGNRVCSPFLSFVEFPGLCHGVGYMMAAGICKANDMEMPLY